MRDLAKHRGLKGISTLRKEQLIERMLEADEKEKQEKAQQEQPETPAAEQAPAPKEYVRTPVREQQL